MHDSGEVQFYKVTDSSTKGQMPKPQYHLIHFTNYEERTVGVSRYGTALQTDNKIALLVRIPETRYIEQGKVVVVVRPYGYVDNSVYSIYQVQHSENEKRLKVCDVSLERLEGLNANEVISHISTICESDL